MKKIKFGHIWLVVVSFLFIVACGPSGSIPTPLDEQTQQLGPYAIAVTCDGVVCGDSVSGDVIVGIKTTPAIDPAMLGTVIACEDGDYPLTLASEEQTAQSSQLTYTHDKLPGVTECTIEVSLLQVSASVDDKDSYLDENVKVEIPIRTMCQTSGSLENPNAEECWDFALVMTPAAAQQAQMGFGFSIGVKAPAITSLIVAEGADNIRALGFTIKFIQGEGLVITGPTDLNGLVLAIYKKFDAAPIVGMNFEHSGMTFVQDMMRTATEGAAIFVADDQDLADTCSTVINQIGVTMNFGGAMRGGGGLKASPPPGEPQLAERCGGYVDSPGFMLAKLSLGLATSGCGFDTTDPDYKTELAERMANMHQGIVYTDQCIVDVPADVGLGIANGWGMNIGEDSYVFDKSGLTEIPSLYFGEYADSYSAGIIYASNIPSDLDGGGDVIIDKSAGWSGEPVPYTLTVKSVDFGGVAAMGEE